MIALPFTTTTLLMSGEGPAPFSSETVAPLIKPAPVIVTEAVVPAAWVLGLMAVTVTPGAVVGVLVGVGGMGVFVGVGGIGVLVGVAVGSGVLVAVGGTEVFVGVGGIGVSVAVGGTGVSVGVGGMGVSVGVGGIGVLVGVGPLDPAAVMRTSSMAASTKLAPAASAASTSR